MTLCVKVHALMRAVGGLGQDAMLGANLMSDVVRTGRNPRAAPTVSLMTLKHSRPSTPYADFLRGFVDPRSQARGKEYYELGLVDELEFEGLDVRAFVRGTLTYDVLLDFEDYAFGGECDCPAFSDRGPCKHMWAVALAADVAREGPSVGPRQVAKVPVLPPKETLAELVRVLERLHEERPVDHVAPASSVEAVDDWESRLRRMETEVPLEVAGVWERALLEAHRVEYHLDLDSSRQQGSPVIHVFSRSRKKNGEFGVTKALRLGAMAGSYHLGEEDRGILTLLEPHAADSHASRYNSHAYGDYYASHTHTAVLAPLAVPHLMPRMAGTGRLLLSGGTVSGENLEESGQPLAWDSKGPWLFRIRLEPGRDGRKHIVRLTGDLVRGDEIMDLAVPHSLFSSGVLLHGTTVAAFDPRGAMQWVVELRRRGPLVVPRAQGMRLAESLAVSAYQAWEHSPIAPPTPVVSLEIGAEPASYRDSLPCMLRMDYGDGVLVNPMNLAGVVPTVDRKGWVERDFDFEVAAVGQLHGMGTMPPAGSDGNWHAQVFTRDVPKVVDRALKAGWAVKAEGHSYRTGGVFSGAVSSGVDWFDLNAGLGFGEEVAPLPAILAAARAGRKYVELGDGSFGVLPENWLKSWGLLELAGKPKGDSLRFDANQGWILDALLTGREAVTGDKAFQGYRERLDHFTKVKAVKEPRSFQGELRPYQRLAVGWFGFLRDLGLGGCLADDMGLGKTVQVLALLEDRRLSQKKLEGGHRPTLVVAPNSLVFNWVAEAERFAPKLRVLDFTGSDRVKRAGGIEDGRIGDSGSGGGKSGAWDLIITTYGTLRRDAVKLADVDFDYVVLDEATAIKNASSQAAKAARLMRARHRLALSGTPIENHLGELWSLLEFLNPGMLGASRAFQRFSKAGRGPEDLAGLSRALAPFFLRRTKGEVLKDLPEKTEQVVLCELGKAERKRYDEVRQHFRAELLGDGGATEEVPGTQKIQVLEALLRLRQCACHPALMDKSLIGESSAKLDELLPRLEELAEEGHKVLVFSQFTSFLKVLRSRLDDRGLVYEYLDGSTRNRKEKVERFQSDEACKLFLISIKAGGHGLNLTAADYVFIMDPWWNPAVEAQAVDRAHRMGQVKPVFAYRLIARDTVEEKVLELQGSKRELAEAVIGEGAGVLRDLTRGDLERLLS